MFVIGETVISDELAERHFVCNLTRCKGACCVEGDAGAPLEEDERAQIEGALPAVRAYMTPRGLEELNRQGPWVSNKDGELETPIIAGRECIYAFYDREKVLKCAFEAAFNEGQTTWPKPMSCHLYPARVRSYDHYVTVNYHQWHICRAACQLGDELQVPLYRFLKGPLMRRFGEAWYEELCHQIEERPAD